LKRLTNNMRRLLWNIYAWPLTLLLAFAAVGSFKEIGLLSVLDSAISVLSLIALHLHIWDKRVLSAKFWKPYAFFFVVWELLWNLLLGPMISGKNFDPVALIAPVILAPLYVGVFRYAFRNWDGRGLSDKSPQPAAAASDN